MPWRAASASVIGPSHRKAQMPCQDASAFASVGETLFGAVADGAGSAARSEVGSRLAVDTALTWMRAFPWPGTAPAAEDIRLAFSDMLGTVVSAINEKAKADNCCASEFATTLLVFVATQHWIAAAQVGDGMIVARPTGGDIELLFRPDKGEYLNETTFVTSERAPEVLQVCVDTRPMLFICAATDGIERVAIRFQDWTAHAPFFKPLEDYIFGLTDAEQGSRDIAEFLDREKLNAKSDDDKTMLLCRYDDPAPPEQMDEATPTP